MKKCEVVKESRDFDKIIHTGKFVKNNELVIYYQFNNSDANHFGISVGKKIGNAVNRNKYKRKITNALSALNIKLDTNVDVFIIAKAAICNIDYNIIYKELAYLFKKLNLLQGEKND